MRRMRTIQQAADWVREGDPNTALTKTAIRRLVLSGEIPHITAGTKRLIALEDIEAYVTGERMEPQTQRGAIRPIVGR